MPGIVGIHDLTSIEPMDMHILTDAGFETVLAPVQRGFINLIPLRAYIQCWPDRKLADLQAFTEDPRYERSPT